MHHEEEGRHLQILLHFWVFNIKCVYDSYNVKENFSYNRISFLYVFQNRVICYYIAQLCQQVLQTDKSIDCFLGS